MSRKCIHECVCEFLVDGSICGVDINKKDCAFYTTTDDVGGEMLKMLRQRANACTCNLSGVCYGCQLGKLMDSYEAAALKAEDSREGVR